jgi:acyl dehydratase
MPTPKFGDLAVGMGIPALSKGPVSRQRLVEWCAAENDYYELHYDERVAARMGLSGTPIQGTYRYALMSVALERWLGGAGRLVRISASYRGLDLEGDVITAKGKVIGLEPKAVGGVATLEVWIENSRGERSTSGEATVEWSSELRASSVHRRR